MPGIGTVELDAEKLRAFADLGDDGTPLHMLNLLRFREQADYAGHPEQDPCSGREAYRRYIELAQPLIEEVAGVRIVVLGAWSGTLIAPDDEHWDDVLLAEYPERRRFLEALTSERYQEIVFHRYAALADSRLIGFRGDASFLG